METFWLSFALCVCVCVCRKRQFVASSSLGTAAKPVQSHSFLRGYYFFFVFIKMLANSWNGQEKANPQRNTQFLFLFFSFLVSPACSVAPLFFFLLGADKRKEKSGRGGGGRESCSNLTGRPVTRRRPDEGKKDGWVHPCCSDSGWYISSKGVVVGVYFASFLFLFRVCVSFPGLFDFIFQTAAVTTPTQYDVYSPTGVCCCFFFVQQKETRKISCCMKMCSFLLFSPSDSPSFCFAFLNNLNFERKKENIGTISFDRKHPPTGAIRHWHPFSTWIISLKEQLFPRKN